MTREEAITILKQTDRIGCNLIKANDEKSTKYNQESIEALGMAIKALEIVEEFEKAQIITGGRLNGRTYAYKCGLEDGKRKALEQEEYYKDLAQSYEKTIVKLTEAVTEQQPNEDCVSRWAVLEEINDWWGITSTSGEPTLCDCIRDLPPVTPTQSSSPAIPLDKVKQARRELYKLPIYGAKFTDDFRIHLDREEVFSILDKLIAESEEK